MATVKPITVKELIAFLQTQQQDLPVIYGIHSEYCLLEFEDIEVYEAQPPRPDGWVHEPRPDKPVQTYLRFPH